MIYEAITNVKIRREPRIVDNILGTNQVGLLTAGTQREVYETVTNKDNSTWGRISEPDSAGISQWACIKGLNRTYMKLIDNQNNPDLITRINHLESWARTQGYKG